VDRAVGCGGEARVWQYRGLCHTVRRAGRALWGSRPALQCTGAEKHHQCDYCVWRCVGQPGRGTAPLVTKTAGYGGWHAKKGGPPSTSSCSVALCTSAIAGKQSVRWGAER
jgi:hypothetical protein